MPEAETAGGLDEDKQVDGNGMIAKKDFGKEGRMTEETGDKLREGWLENEKEVKQKQDNEWSEILRKR